MALDLCFHPGGVISAAMDRCQTPRSLRSGVRRFAPLVAAALLALLLAGMQQTAAFPSWRLEVCCVHFTTRWQLSMALSLKMCKFFLNFS